jgi:hypothetical protein
MFREPVAAPPSDYLASVAQERPKRRRRRMRASTVKTITIAVELLFLCGLVVLGYLSYTWFFNTATYSSTKSSLSFRYPKSWQTVDPKDVNELSKLDITEDLSNEVNEVILADEVSVDAEWALFAGNFTGLTYTNWNEVKPGMVDELSKEFASGWTGTPLQFEDVTVDGAPALGLSFTEPDQGRTIQYKAIIFTRDKMVFLLFMGSIKDPGEVNAQWQKIVQSVKLRQ